MARFICITGILFFILGFNKKKEDIHMSKVVKLEPKTIVNVFFPTDGGVWTDQIISAYTQQLTMVRSDLNFVNVSWTKDADLKIFLANVVAAKPDIVFLPDDLMYLQLGPEIQKVTNAQIVFATFYSERTSLETIVKNPIGVVAEAPVAFLLKNASLLGKVDSVGIIGGPYAEKIIGHIKGKLGNVKVESVQTDSWFQYAEKSKDFAKKHDVIFPLPTFGVKNTNGTPVTDDQLNALVEEIPKICLGYGQLSGYRMTIDMDIDPIVLGKNAAALSFAYLKGEKVGISEFTSYAMRIDDRHLQRLKLKVPENLKGFVSLR